MIFNPANISEILRIIQFNHVLFAGMNIGTDILTNEDILLLKEFGINPNEIKTDYSPFEKQFYFGRLSQALGNKNAASLQYNDFLQYLRRSQYIPLNEREKATLEIAKRRTYGHVKYLGQKVIQTTEGLILSDTQARRDKYEATIKGSIERAVFERNSINSVISEIGHKTGDWGRDLGRIAATEMQAIFEEGRAAEIERTSGKDSEVYKEVYAGACRFCIQFYTTGGIGSKPRVFKLSDLRANGSNIGRKQASWQPTLDPVHPWCRCFLTEIKEGYIWNEEKNMFTPPPIDKNAPKKGIKITVGDKVFEI